jgi:capsular exopolysaccharide synthesis family protein
MTRLFEALQRSETERSGTPLLSLPISASELLAVAEKETSELRECETLHLASAPDNRLVCLTAKESLGAEKFRFLAVRLRELQQVRALKRILVTSTLAEEGKSLVSANLAVTLARRHWQKVLLIDGDLRRPVLARQFGVGKLAGISEWLRDDNRSIPSIYRLEEPGFYFLPAGRPPENPLELMQSGRLRSMLDEINAWFDWIVIDSPPVLPLADTSVWMRMADGALLVVREGKSEKRQLKAGLENLGSSNLLGVVLNSCTNTDHRKYYQRYHQAPPLPLEQTK